MEVITTIEEAPTSFVSEELCLLKDTYQDEGEYVDPFDFASLESYSLNFLVAAKVTNQTRYTAENFLCYLTPERLGALRQMHAEMMG